MNFSRPLISGANPRIKDQNVKVEKKRSSSNNSSFQRWWMDLIVILIVFENDEDRGWALWEEAQERIQAKKEDEKVIEMKGTTERNEESKKAA